MQFLDQEVQPLADLAAFLQHGLDLIEVRRQPAQFLGHVDADGEGRGLGQGALLRGLGADLAVAAGQRLVPARDEALFLRLHRLRHQRLGGARQFAQLCHALADQLGQARTFARTRGDEIVQHGLRQFHQRLGGAFVVGRFGAAGRAQRVGHRQRRGIRQPHAHLVLHRGQALQHSRGWVGQGAGVAALQVGAQLDLAALQALAQQLAQGRFVLAQFVGQAKAEVQKTAVDRAQLQPQPGLRILPRRGVFGAAVGGLLTAGITGHTVN